jgi:hypothetical protein
MKPFETESLTSNGGDFLKQTTYCVTIIIKVLNVLTIIMHCNEITSIFFKNQQNGHSS